MKRLRIVHVVDPEAPSGARLCEAVRTRLPVDEFEHCVLHRCGASAWMSALRVVRQAQTPAGDVVHLWDRWGVRCVAPLLDRRRALVCTVHSPQRFDATIDRWIERRSLRRATTIVSHDAAVRAFELRRFGDADAGLADRWIVFPDGADPMAESDVAAAREAVRRRLRLPDDARLLGVVCRQVPDKNVKDVLWVTTLLRVLHADVRAIVVGAGPQHAVLRRFARQLRVDDATYFLPETESASQLIASLDLYVDAARWDGPAAAIDMAQAAGVPVVCVDTPVRMRQIDPGASGLSFAEHDRATLVRRLHLLLSDSERREALARRARDWSTERESLAATAARYAAVYRAACRSRLPVGGNRRDSGAAFA